MSISRHHLKVAMSSATIAAALARSIILGSANAQDVEMTIMGDNVILHGNTWSENRFHIGAILQGDGNGLDAQANASTEVVPPGSVPTSTPHVDDVLGDGTNTELPVTTVLQAMTGVMLSGVNDIAFGPAYTWAREYGITTVSPSSAGMDRAVIRYEFAKMMLAYIRNVENKTLAENEQCNIRNYADYNGMENSVRAVVQDACNTGLMGRRSVVGVNQTITTPLARFRPYDILTTAELNIVLNRYVPSTVRLFPTSNTRSAIIRFLYTIAPEQ